MKKQILIMCCLALAYPLTASAVAVKADPSTAYLNSVPVPLSPQELAALDISSQWWAGGSPPFLGRGGKLVYVHGASVPTVLAAPFQVTDVELESGETVNEIVVGDSARWMVEAGTAGNTTHLFIKPVDAGLETTAVVTTDRRVYHLRLVSRSSGHTPYVGFVYNDAIQRIGLQQHQQNKKRDHYQSTTDNVGATVDLSTLNFDYEIYGDVPWRPERVYDDGLKTYVQLPKSTRAGEMPTLLVRKGDTDVIVNYRVKNTTLMVDGLFEKIALIAGVGDDQEICDIRRLQ